MRLIQLLLILLLLFSYLQHVTAGIITKTWRGFITSTTSIARVRYGHKAQLIQCTTEGSTNPSRLIEGIRDVASITPSLSPTRNRRCFDSHCGGG